MRSQDAIRVVLLEFKVNLGGILEIFRRWLRSQGAYAATFFYIYLEGDLFGYKTPFASFFSSTSCLAAR
jgi:hypothetical protein